MRRRCQPELHFDELRRSRYAFNHGGVALVVSASPAVGLVA